MTRKPEPTTVQLRAHISRRDPAVISRALAKTWDDPFAEGVCDEPTR